MKYFLCGCILLLCSFISRVSAQEYLAEAKSGYTGGFNTEIKTLDAAVNFIVLGDWGRNGQYYQTQVAEQMGKVAATTGNDFVITVGDNFYPSGVQSVQDPQWRYSFEDVYRSHFLQNNWYVALGNHDYKGNIQAQLDYSSISRRWYLPAKYYSKKIKLKDGSILLLVIMDTTPFVGSYYTKGDEVTENVAKQDTAAQRKWQI